jgi:hypothetical protein
VAGVLRLAEARLTSALCAGSRRPLGFGLEAVCECTEADFSDPDVAGCEADEDLDEPQAVRPNSATMTTQPRPNLPSVICLSLTPSLLD